MSAPPGPVRCLAATKLAEAPSTSTMKFNELLRCRDDLLRHAHLANLAYAYQCLGEFAERIERAGLRGSVTLRGPDPESGRKVAELIADDFSQAVLQEHFLEEEITELHAVFAFVHGGEVVVELKLQLDEVAARYLPSLRHVLEAADVLPKQETSPVEDPGADTAL
jgi:hypothetical protein